MRTLSVVGGGIDHDAATFFISMKGYVKLRRGIVEHFKEMSLEEIGVFVTLCCTANFKKEEAGLSKITINQLAETLNIDRRRVSKACKSLIEKRYITQKGGSMNLGGRAGGANHGGFLVLNFDGEQPENHTGAVYEPGTPQKEIAVCTCGTSQTICGVHNMPLRCTDYVHAVYESCTPHVQIMHTATPEPESTQQLEPPKNVKNDKNEKKKAIYYSKRQKSSKKTTSQNRKKSEEILWDSEAKDFVGPGLEALLEKLKERYEGELGKDWLNREWTSICEWADDNPQRIATMTNLKLFLLQCYRSGANRERAKRDYWRRKNEEKA